MKKVFKNFISSDGKNITVAEENGIIVSDNSGADEIIDGSGQLYLFPGFIDLHIHGGGGYDFMDAVDTEYEKIAHAHALHGTTAMLPTTLAAKKEETLAVFETYRKVAPSHAGARFLGLHIEGPYISKDKKGALDEEYILSPDPDYYKKLFSLSDDIKRVTVAPELDGAIEFGKYLAGRGILPSLGHTDANYTEVEKAYREGGYTMSTHLYSAMSMTHRKNAFRFGGAVEAVYLIDGIDTELIADGIHLPPELIRLAYKIKGAERICLVTDAMRAAATVCTESILGSRAHGIKVLIEDDCAKMPDRTAFAGSTATTDRLLKTAVNVASLPLADAVKMLTETPARIIGASDRIGSLIPGKFADINIFDKELNIVSTYISGEPVK